MNDELQGRDCDIKKYSFIFLETEKNTKKNVIRIASFPAEILT